MKLSWSHKLFLRLNEHVGEQPALDRFMIFCARWLIYIFISVVINWGIFGLSGNERILFFATLAAALAPAYAVSLAIGLSWPHCRPIKELPQVKTLVQTLGNWKSFPSDHTLWSFVMALVVLFFAPPAWLAVGSLVSAFLIGVSRVYIGVHYPRDVIGGFILALFFSIGSYFVLSYLS